MPSDPALPKPLAITSIVLQVAVAGLFVMMSLGKLTGNADAKFIFETVGIEPVGRYATGVAELLAAVLLLVPRATAYGAMLSLLVVLGAIGSHLTTLGVSVTLPSSITPEHPAGQTDPTMFVMAVAVLLASAAVLVIRRAQLPGIGPRLAGKAASSIT